MGEAQAGPVLLVEDDAALGPAIATSLQLAGHEVYAHGDAAQALAAIDARFAGVVVSDLRMPGMDGWQFFAALQALDPDLPVIFMTGHGNIDQAVSALQQGAYDFVAKPFAPPRLIASVARAMEKRRLVLDNRRLHAAAIDAGEAANPFASLLPLAGESLAMAALRATLAHVGDAEIDVLIEGEPGTGRDRVARLLHDTSRRRARAFTSINCAAAQPAALAAEMFGAQSDGRRSRPGRLALAERGTVFLDNVETLPADLQMRLLGALDSGEMAPAGSRAAQPLDIRVIAAAGSDLDEAMAAGAFQPALLVRLGALRVRLPPLRERCEDVPLLFARLAANAAQRFGQPLPPLSAGIRAHLLSHDWPGNLRELAHFAERFVLGLEFEAGEGVGGGGGTSAGPTLVERMARIEAGLLRETLSAGNGHIIEVARRLGLPRKTLYDKLARHGINPAVYRRKPGRAPR